MRFRLIKEYHAGSDTTHYWVEYRRWYSFVWWPVAVKDTFEEAAVVFERCKKLRDVKINQTILQTY